MRVTIAIDGPAAAGKGTISRAVADYFGIAHLDTGLLYRAVGAKMLNGDEVIEAARNLKPEDLHADGLRSPEVAIAASEVAVILDVRNALIDFQQNFARRAGGAVLDGRDIGTVICPDADVKLFITARAEVRADRRYQELLDNGMKLSRELVLQDVLERDKRDCERTEAPLRPAQDAVVIDTSDMNSGEAISVAIASIEKQKNGIKV